MDKKTGPGGVGAMGGKGFYIVLFLCAAVIGVSAWILISDVGTNVEEMEAAQNTVDISGAYVTMVPRSAAEAPVIIETDKAEPVMAEEEPEPEIEPKQEPDPEPIEVKPVFNETVTSYVWPVRGEIEVPYSMETLLYDATMADWRTHDGVDISCTAGDKVIAAAGGTIVNVWKDDLYGTCVELDHANGVHTVYCNLAEEPPVGEGDVVAMGQIIGSVGGTALAETNEVAHLHFAVKCDGRSADPMDYLDSDYAEDQ